ncbi:ATP-grasp domain-containing protein [Streptomyces genisteinicus]|uniref:ATP-grasp domain-containing protein n=1 Tax=Streptomyces genisteinicus TaxID=2768068 RepID=A0A7H0I510_9ACTN|nr:ATP-grasp domain-containing protein [Streptomyces genisteinicus]QNP67876.1 ATP-grasp domain-containing protein [Streptomyces genisteinicus]
MSKTPDPMHLLIVSGGRDLPDRARDALPGLRTTVICRPEVVPRLRSREKIQRLIVLREDAPVEEWVAAARFVHSVDPVHRLTNFTEKDTEKTAAIGLALDLPWHSPRTVRAVADKCAMRRTLADAGVGETLAEVVHDAEGILKVADRSGYPLICKPVRGVASKGVTRVDGPDDIPRALAWGAVGAGDLDSPDLLVEPFLSGEEYSVESVSEDGEHLVVGITRKLSEPDHFVEIGHVVPAPLPDADEDRIASTVRAMLTALGVRTGVTHTEVIVAPGAVHIVETHLRPAGDEIPELWARVSGVDLIDVVARQAVGIKVLDDVRAALAGGGTEHRSAAIWYACPDAVGEIVSVEGEEEARALEGVVDVEVLREPGKRLKGVTGSFARAAHVCAVGGTPEEALARAREGVRALSFTVRSAGMAERHDTMAS